MQPTIKQRDVLKSVNLDGLLSTTKRTKSFSAEEAAGRTAPLLPCSSCLRISLSQSTFQVQHLVLEFAVFLLTLLQSYRMIMENASL
jgi:hypothetical protein